MELVTNRDCIVRTTAGHVVAFKANKPRNVPGAIVEQCMAIGAIPTKPEKVKIAKAALIIDEKPIPIGTARKNVIVEAIRLLVTRNARNDFSASGIPTLPAINNVVGFEVDVKERNTLWAEIQPEIV